MKTAICEINVTDILDNVLYLRHNRLAFDGESPKDIEFTVRLTFKQINRLIILVAFHDDNRFSVGVEYLARIRVGGANHLDVIGDIIIRDV